MHQDNAKDAVDIVIATPFDERHIASVMHLSCGPDLAVEATLWIHGKGTPCVCDELADGTRVWLYTNSSNEVVGFGSLGVTTWEIDGRPAVGVTPTTVQLIPMLGIFSDFQGCPPPGSGSVKYCYQVLDHLIDEAEANRHVSNLLGLSVHPDNTEAIYVYEKTGFEWIATVGGGFSRMMLVL